MQISRSVRTKRQYLKNLYAALAAVIFLAGCSEQTPAVVEPTLVSLRGATMGTTYSILCWQDDGPIDEQALLKPISDLLEQINQQMSTYIADSELSQFNTTESTDWFTVSPETAFVVEQALHFNEITGGASDVTVGPLVKIWNFGPGKNPLAKPPSDEEIAKVLESVGCRHVEVRLNPPALRKELPGLAVDLSSIAKGYGVDAVTELLLDRGIENVMVEIGGEVRAAGTRIDKTPWRIGVDPPAMRRRKFHKIVPLSGMSMATSGDYRNFLKSEERKYCHIIDPRTGQPLEYRGCSVTVLTETCLEADALATALLVLGDQAGYDWCVEQNVAAMFLLRAGENVEERATPRFEAVAPALSTEGKK